MIKTNKLVRPKVMVIPCENVDIERFSSDNKRKMYLHIMKCIQYAFDRSEDMIEIFMFAGTNYFVILHRKDYISSLEHIFSYFMENELYEECSKIKAVKDKLVSYSINIKSNFLT
jgi:hypothetical protein